MRRPKQVDLRWAHSQEVQDHVNALNGYIDVLEGQIEVLKSVMKPEPKAFKPGDKLPTTGFEDILSAFFDRPKSS